MKEILCKFFGFFKYILLIISFGLVFYGIIVTYGRLEKPLTDAIFVFLPFAFVLLTFIITLIVKSKSVGENLLFNFVAVFVFLVVIIICLRAMFDTNMILFYRYGIDYNPAFFSDNLSAIEAMLYMIGGSNVVLLLCDLVNREKKPKKVKTVSKNKKAQE
ncbi:MAG: hypothetical protein ACI31R_03800 [Bacilli bacterium]